MAEWTPPTTDPNVAYRCFKSLVFDLLAYFLPVLGVMLMLVAFMQRGGEEKEMARQVFFMSAFVGAHIASFAFGHFLLQQVPAHFHRYLDQIIGKYRSEMMLVETGFFSAALIFTVLLSSVVPQSKPHVVFFLYAVVSVTLRLLYLGYMVLSTETPLAAGPAWLTEPLLFALRDMWKSKKGSTAFMLAVGLFCVAIPGAAVAFTQSLPAGHAFARLFIFLFSLCGGLITCPLIVLTICFEPVFRYQAARYRKPPKKRRLLTDNPHDVARGFDNRILVAHLAAMRGSNEVDNTQIVEPENKDERRALPHIGTR